MGDDRQAVHFTVHALGANRPGALTAAALNEPLAVSFEQAYEALEQLERMFIEPDGALVWVSSAADNPWQIDVLHDRGDRLSYVELKGYCPPEALDRLLGCFGWPDTSLVFQLVREGRILDEAAFRQWLYGEASRPSS